MILARAGRYPIFMGGGGTGRDGDRRASEGKTCYLVPHGERTILAGKQGGRLQDDFDGTTRTMMAAEIGDDAAVIWSKPDDWQIGGIVDFKPLLGYHPGWTNILFADGSLRFVKQTISRAMLKALLTRDGGEVISPDAY
jgi:prepilin-type processing-associated H-X9-DG protein